MNEIVVTTYAEHSDDPKTWQSPEPSFDLAKFNRELERRGGYFHGMPRFRCRWAGHLEDYVIEDYDVHTGWMGKDADGKEIIVPVTQGDFEFPDGVIASPHYENFQIFTPRYVIEEFQEATGENFGAVYRKAWFIENIKTISKAHGRVDVESYYRQPSEIDIQMAEQLTRVRISLTDADAKAGIEALKALHAREKERINDELTAEIREETVRALTDGMPNAKQFVITPSTVTDIHSYSKNLVREHNAKL